MLSSKRFVTAVAAVARSEGRFVIADVEVFNMLCLCVYRLLTYVCTHTHTHTPDFFSWITPGPDPSKRESFWITEVGFSMPDALPVPLRCQNTEGNAKH